MIDRDQQVRRNPLVAVPLVSSLAHAAQVWASPLASRRSISVGSFRHRWSVLTSQLVPDTDGEW